LWQRQVNGQPVALSAPDIEYFVRRLRELAQDRGWSAAHIAMFTTVNIKQKAPNFTSLLGVLWQ